MELSSFVTNPIEDIEDSESQGQIDTVRLQTNTILDSGTETLPSVTFIDSDSDEFTEDDITETVYNGVITGTFQTHY